MSFTITVVSKAPQTVKSDLLLLPIFAKGKVGEQFSPTQRRQIEAKAKQLGFSGAFAQTEVFLAPTGSKATFIGLIGLGAKETHDFKQWEALRRGLGRAMQEARRHLLFSVTLDLTHLSDMTNVVGAAVEAATLADYRFTAHAKGLQKEQNNRGLKQLTLAVPPLSLKEAAAAVKTTQVVTKAATRVRHLVNQPASHLKPVTLVEEAEAIAQRSPLFSLRILDREAAQAAGMNAFLAVAQGSIEEPYVIHLVYKPEGAKKRIVLVGKGITFDSGGLSLKPAQYMEDMKMDMAGAATVLGALSTLPALKLPVEVHAIVATCENMPSGEAFRPSDILTAKNGTTIEVLNTDAEGRLTLADALSLALEVKPDAIVDLATLTGACVMAVGETHAGLWSNDEELQASVIVAAQAAGEGVVAFPLPEEYKAAIKSKVADLRNIGTTRWGDAILAALFLQEFVKDTPWAHLDIAGPAHLNASVLPYYAHGATAYGLRTLIQFLRAQAA